MKSETRIFNALHAWAVLLLAIVACALVGCSKARNQEASRDREELAQLRRDNDELKKLRTENRELDRLRRDSQELPKLRSQQAELANARQENEALHQQLSGARTGGVPAHAANAMPQGNTSARPLVDPVTGQPLPAVAATETQTNIDLNIPQENDELFVDPKFLRNILPGFDWDKLKRTEPVSVRGLLEQSGITLTNYQQLIAIGITNYQVRRNPPAPETQPAK